MVKRICQIEPVYYVVLTLHICIKKDGLDGIDINMVLFVQNVMTKIGNSYDK